MINIANYDKVEPIIMNGDYERLKLGYQECIIKDAYVFRTKSNIDSLVLELDIYTGDNKDYFQIYCIQKLIQYFF